MTLPFPAKKTLFQAELIYLISPPLLATIALTIELSFLELKSSITLYF
jgi:hypothetical protein